MNWLLEITLILLLATAFVQDYKSRSIHLFVFIGIAVLSTAIFLLEDILMWNVIGLNALFVIVVMMLLFLYTSVKEAQFVNIFKQYFGLGDLLFFLVVTPLLSQRNFILFFITGLVLSGLVHWLLVSKKSGKTIPLAGYLSIYLILLRATDYCLVTNLFYTDLI